MILDVITPNGRSLSPTMLASSALPSIILVYLSPAVLVG